MPRNAAEKENRIVRREEKPVDPTTGLPPSTPAARLPLAELVGNVDDSSRHVVKAATSPEEQLCWRGSQPITTPLPRKRKRARSSSPAGPSQEEPQLPPHNVKELTTPQADPATELWNRYNNDKDTPSGNRGIAFAHLISEASPRSSATAGSVSGLRRWASCGLEFPASTRKKRRTHAPIDAPNDLTDHVYDQPSSDGIFQGQPQGKSKLAGMLERIRESIGKPQSGSQSQVPSSSSPLPDSERRITSNDSPLKDRGREAQLHDTSEALVGNGQAKARNNDEVEAGSSDEFGDIDFDDEIVENLEILPFSSAVNKAQHAKEANPVQVHAVPTTLVEPGLLLAKAEESDDEFGLDEDMFEEDLEQVASLFDSRPEQSQEQRSATQDNFEHEQALDAAPPPLIIDLAGDDDDDFGDDIDVDEFAAAEVAATQNLSTAVRRLLTSW